MPPVTPRALCASANKQVSGIDPLLVAYLDRATEDIDRVVETIERRGDSTSGGGGGAASIGSRVSKRSGMGSSRGKGPKRCAYFFFVSLSLPGMKLHSLHEAL